MPITLKRRTLPALLALLVFGANAALPPEALVPPAEPSVAPLIARTYPQDANQDRVADDLMAAVGDLDLRTLGALTPEEMNAAQRELDALVDVQLVFSDQVTQSQIDLFAAFGGEITYIYRAISYGWNGRVPLTRVPDLPTLLGPSLLLVDSAKAAEKHLNIATRTGRVRPIWAAHFVAGTNFEGSTNITVAIVDTGVDESHTDLNGRRVFWHDYTSSAEPSPVDFDEHGSHVAGIAFGTGASGGTGGPLRFSQSGTLAGVAAGSFFPDPIDLPAVSVIFHLKAQWAGGGSTTLHLASQPKGGGSFISLSSVSGTSPIELTLGFSGDVNTVYTPALLAAASVQDFIITCQVTNYVGVGDGFNTMRGVAPGCNWAGAKVFQNDGNGVMTDTDAALDDLVANRVAKKIKVMNLSLGAIGNPGISTTTRQKVNTAVNNGIVVVVSAGNDGTKNSPGMREIDDPGRAAMALTIAAANDVNQLTDYTSQGFTSPGSTAGQEEDYKPDVMAPGGSAGYYTSILSVDSNTSDGAPFSDQQTQDYVGLQGTSMASPFSAGCAALVIHALESLGTNWNFSSGTHSRLVKMLLCATASESNTNREGDANNPTLERASSGPSGYPVGKDRNEGYGMINPDAAVAAVMTRFTTGLTNASLGPGTMDQRVWASTVNLTNGRKFTASLTNPATGDFDLYLYSRTPSAYGTPVLLASSARSGAGVNEALTNTPSSDTNAILVVKRVSGFGTFSLRARNNTTPSPLNPLLGTSTNRPVTMTSVKLATDADGDPLSFSVSATSAQGGTVSLVSGVVTYTPPAGYSGADTFTYTVNDGQGGTTNGTVSVTVAAGNVVSLNIVFGPAIVSGNFVVRFAGIPGRTYTVEHAASVTGPWSKATNVTAPVTDTGFGVGVFQFSEPTSTSPSGFYRTVYPSY